MRIDARDTYIHTPRGVIDLRICPPDAESRAGVIWLAERCASCSQTLAELRSMTEADPRMSWVCAIVDIMVATLQDAQPDNLYLSEYEVEPIVLACACTTKPAF